jgi:hypothetical protein
MERRVLGAGFGQKLEERALRHVQRLLEPRRDVHRFRALHEGAVGKVNWEVGAAGLLDGEEPIEEAELVHELEGRGMHAIAAVVTVERISTFEEHDVDALARKQERHDHAARPTADDDTLCLCLCCVHVRQPTRRATECREPKYPNGAMGIAGPTARRMLASRRGSVRRAYGGGSLCATSS